MTISKLTLKSGEEDPVRRFEVFTGAGRRRDWSDDDKARIVAESYEPGASVSEVARRHALSPQQLFGWRRLLRRTGEDLSLPPSPMFVPAVTSPPPQDVKRRSRRRVDRDAGIELEIDGVLVRVGAGASPKAIAAVIGALKAGS